MSRGVWGVTLLLVLIGVAAALHRGLFLGDAAAHADPARMRLFERLHLADPLRAEPPAELARVDGKFGAHPALTLLHVIAGALFLAFAPLQFVARLRARHPRVHRISGRLLVLAALLSAIPAFYFGVAAPFGGPVEAAATLVFGGLLLVSLAVAVRAIRAGRIALHREWMIRAFAVALAISTIRLVAAVVDPLFSPLGYRLAPLFATTLWIGWLLTLGVAEWWIRITRGR